MATINQLPLLSTLVDGDQFVVWSVDNGDSRRVPYGTLRTDLLNSVTQDWQSEVATLTNKTIALGSNALSGTLAQFNTACTDADFQPTTYTPAGTGAVTRTVVSKLNEVLSVKDFGATGDGVTNDAAAIQAAVNAATANQTVYFPPGTYAVGAAGIAVTNKTGVTLLGDGAIILITAISTLTTNLGVATIRLSGCTRSGVRGLEINGNGIASSAIGFNACTECFVDKVTAYASGVNGQITSSNGGLRNEFTDNLVYSARLPSSRGLWLGNVNASDMETDIFVSGNTVRNNPASGIVVSSNGGRVIGNHAKTNEGSGIVLPGANGFSAKNLTVTGNYCIDNLFFGIQSDVVGYTTDADLTVDITVSGNVCNANNRGSGGVGGGGIYAVNSERWVITGNTCNDNAVSGIQADDRSRNVTITGNTCSETRVGGARTQLVGIRANAQAASNYGIVICGNTCVNNTQHGIGMATVGAVTISNVTITGNNCYSNSISGIFVAEATASAMINFVVTGNVCNLNTTNDLRLSLRDVAIGSNRYTLNQNVDFLDLTVNSTTPGVAGRTYWRANNSSATTITAFNDGVNGQQITIRAQNGNTTVATSASIVNNGGLNVLLPTDGTISYVRQGTVWREIFRSF
jgi:parallel beta-helix repeat protein